MKKFIILESEKIRILEMHKSRSSRQYLKENDDNVVKCVAEAFGLTTMDILNLAPCATFDLSKCVEAIKNLDAVKCDSVFDFSCVTELAKKSTKALACATGFGGDSSKNSGISLPGFGGGMIDIK